jgi:lipid-A-disaccharide synthase
MRRALLVAGESSGDLHGSLLARELQRRAPDLELFGVGGREMEAAGVELILRSEELSVVGLLEVLEVLPRILRAYETVQAALAERRPDVFVPIDFPDFNFRLLPRAYRLGIPTAYYVSPQVWAWRLGRIAWLKRYVRRMIVIFPFEKQLYESRGVPVSWVGHPLVDRIAPADGGARGREDRRRALGLDPGRPVVALLPGSRRSEVARIEPVLRETRERIDQGRREAGREPVQWLVGRAPGLPDGLLDRLTPPAAAPAGIPPGGREALEAADLALVASGTATLEASLLGTPVIVVYRMHPLTYAIARRLVRVDRIAMANLVAGERVVPEFVQDAAVPAAIAGEALRLLDHPEELGRIRGELIRARERLGPPGAAGRAAEAVLEVMEEAR